MGDNLFGAVFNYIQQLIQTADPFKQTALHKMKEALQHHATLKTPVPVTDMLLFEKWHAPRAPNA